ncbi:MAG: hypothetical protein KF894_29950 [Labilithrix sp.]|nr:hypothetical protein [Labilithrix sp.]
MGPATNAGGTVAPRFPETFRSLAALRVLNVLAVGFSLAAAAGATFTLAFGTATPFSHAGAAITAFPTFAFAILWSTALRHRATLGTSNIRWGWLGSIPLAIANAATVSGLYFAAYGERNAHWLGNVLWLQGAIFGATFGAIFWIPGLIATLACFGVPIAWSQRLAKKGLAGEERGELVVGLISTVSAILAFVGLFGRGGDDAYSRMAEPPVAVWNAVVVVMALLGAATGSIAAVFAWRRERVRRAFVHEVEAGAVEGYRVDATDEGKVLVRVTSMGEGYRVASFAEPIYGLGEIGDAQRSMAIRE